MSTYLVGDISVQDEERYRDYVAQVPALVAKHEGEYLVRGGDATHCEGDWQPSRMVVIRFPTRQHAQAFVDDPDYAPVKAIRHAVATSQLVLVDGI